ncbi:hypothetical protein [Brevibacillus fortis]|uniref:hypothetical protein n=1 Tax=Brevibacillus fortis TaxID=2126352 RepID=UPI0038FC0ECF
MIINISSIAGKKTFARSRWLQPDSKVGYQKYENELNRYESSKPKFQLQSR